MVERKQYESAAQASYTGTEATRVLWTGARRDLVTDVYEDSDGVDNFHIVLMTTASEDVRIDQKSFKDVVNAPTGSNSILMQTSSPLVEIPDATYDDDIPSLVSLSEDDDSDDDMPSLRSADARTDDDEIDKE